MSDDDCPECDASFVGPWLTCPRCGADVSEVDTPDE